VIIPTHNGRSTIARAVSSVLNQSHPELELVVVCDGDGSRTRELLAEMTDPRLRIVEQPKSGVSAARNLGAAVAQHEWITFLDDDDTARPRWLESWASAITKDTMVLTARLAFWEGDRQSITPDCRLDQNDPTMNASTILPGGFAVRRGVFMAVDGFDEFLTYSENQDLGLRLLDYLHEAGATAIVHIPEVLVDFHREAAASRARRYRSAPADSARVFLSRYKRRLDEDPATNASLLRIISRAERHEHRVHAAVSSSMRACRVQPMYRANYESLALATLSAPLGAIARVASRFRSLQ
jgi:glycosyltransferase involved in cell wall biosynthesis